MPLIFVMHDSLILQNVDFCIELLVVDKKYADCIYILHKHPSRET